VVTRLPAWVRRGLVGLLALAGLYLVVDVAYTALFVVSSRTRWRPGLESMRWFNKRVANPVVLRFQKSKVTEIHHTGRKSGKGYVTPVWAERVEDSFLIHLPYGADVDWCRNVVAAGGCTIMHDGVRFDTAAPRIVRAAEALPLVPPRMRRADQLMNVESYLRLDIVPVPAEAGRH